MVTLLWRVLVLKFCPPIKSWTNLLKVRIIRIVPRIRMDHAMTNFQGSVFKGLRNIFIASFMKINPSFYFYCELPRERRSAPCQVSHLSRPCQRRNGTLSKFVHICATTQSQTKFLGTSIIIISSLVLVTGPYILPTTLSTMVVEPLTAPDCEKLTK